MMYMTASTLTWRASSGGGALSHPSIHKHLVDEQVSITSGIIEMNTEHWLMEVTTCTC